MISTTVIAQVKGRRIAELIVNGLYNELTINAGMTAIHSEDTEFTYLIVTDDKLTTRKTEAAKFFASGASTVWKSL